MALATRGGAERGGSELGTRNFEMRMRSKGVEDVNIIALTSLGNALVKHISYADVSLELDQKISPVNIR